MEFGLAWQGPEFVSEAEASGLRAFTTGDFADHDAYVTLTEMVHSTSTALVGTAVAYAFSRTPFAHAASLRQLSATAGDRLFLGLGTGAYTINRDWLGVPADKPLARMGEVIQVIRAYLHAENGEAVEYHGQYYDISARIEAPVLGRIDVPILIGAFNRGMVRLAGRRADGMIGHGLFTARWWNDVVRPSFAAGREAASRTGTYREYGWLITAIDDDDPERAIQDARRMIAFYFTVATYDTLAELEGWTDEVRAIRAAFRDRDAKAMTAAVTDRMLEQIAICGTTEQARQMMRARAGSLPRDVAFIAPPSYLVSRQRRQRYARTALALVRDGQPRNAPPNAESGDN